MGGYKMIEWEKTGLLKGLEEADKYIVSSMLDKASQIIKPENYNAFLPVVRLCYNASGLTDIEWLIKDFEKWLEEEAEMVNNILSAYRALDAEVEIENRYTDIHGNRYIKQHGLGRKQMSDKLYFSIRVNVSQYDNPIDKFDALDRIKKACEKITESGDVGVFVVPIEEGDTRVELVSHNKAIETFKKLVEIVRETE
jgi:uncharacterized protein YfbU (UPF0304 family)